MYKVVAMAIPGIVSTATKGVFAQSIALRLADKEHGDLAVATAENRTVLAIALVAARVAKDNFLFIIAANKIIVGCILKTHPTCSLL
ncbi:hypothetical protein UH38_05900 [Aliterella atlantica CENA595]|uniref:Uncharacterized protein n=1 Tax=Aliterella atlantica CENA595 TaxID=1618023 RepID=A0A0D8ZW28_9CYAN|nr:hypothetical protein UH38_05900 [Aliterella atlantica CENA595]